MATGVDVKLQNVSIPTESIPGSTGLQFLVFTSFLPEKKVEMTDVIFRSPENSLGLNSLGHSINEAPSTSQLPLPPPPHHH